MHLDHDQIHAYVENQAALGRDRVSILSVAESVMIFSPSFTKKLKFHVSHTSHFITESATPKNLKKLIVAFIN